MIKKRQIICSSTICDGRNIPCKLGRGKSICSLSYIGTYGVKIRNIRFIFGYLYSGTEKPNFTKKHVLLLIVLFVIGAGAVFGYGVYSYNTTSLSASYQPAQRLARNRAIEEYVLEKHPELKAEETVCIIESAYPKAFRPEVTYQVAVYKADVSGAENAEELMTELEGLSKSKAAVRAELEKLFTEEIVLTENAKEPEKGREQK